MTASNPRLERHCYLLPVRTPRQLPPLRSARVRLLPLHNCRSLSHSLHFTDLASVGAARVLGHLRSLPRFAYHFLEPTLSPSASPAVAAPPHTTGVLCVHSTLCVGRSMPLPFTMRSAAW
ncbi:hypothetical protein GUJ93_ZPchr0010g9845 [Zizania palustris]|uniref:Uncharacterized protein n=1 Tax=Zizania palustris TaxID=103762 RepID=A0A8J6BJM5_ZIZPA|nr:hypothetical protein GUJ93_ZPchr0010g9845 [Zizania palustris]